MSDLEAVLREIREFRRETADGLNGIREDLRTTNVRIDEAERRIAETEERVLNTEEITRELIKLHKRIEERQIDQEGRARRENIRLHGIKEGAEKNVESVGSFVEVLLREKLELPPEYQLNLERAHRALGPPPSEDAPPRSIVAKFSSYKCKEDIIKKAWEKKGFLFEGKRVYVDHDYAPEVMKKRKEYAEAKRVLRENKIRFQTPFPAKFRVFYEGDTRLYNSAAEATRDMVDRGFQVRIVNPAVDPLERFQHRMWRSSRGAGRQDQAETSTLGYKAKLQSFRRTKETAQDRKWGICVQKRLMGRTINGHEGPLTCRGFPSELGVSSGKVKDCKTSVLETETHLTDKEHEKLKRMGYNQEFSSSYKLGRRRGVSILISGVESSHHRRWGIRNPRERLDTKLDLTNAIFLGTSVPR
ncbi:hypothetical protein F2P79_023722 [Pimephales promelas]|nr:hypothetical protein F2P79_023722 [Pimephales promelas]